MSASITSGTYPRATRATRPTRPTLEGAVAPFRRAALTTWNFLCGLGAQRARGQLYRLAAHHEITDPALARSLRDAARHAGEQ